MIVSVVLALLLGTMIYCHWQMIRDPAGRQLLGNSGVTALTCGTIASAVLCLLVVQRL